MKNRSQIPFINPFITKTDRDAVAGALKKNWMSNGPAVRDFESAVARYLHVKHVVAVASGTAAIHLALLSAGLQPGDEVILPALTYGATLFAVQLAGCRPILCDSDVSTLHMDLEKLTDLITPRTRAIITVDLHGQPENYDVLRATVAGRNIALIGDSSQAFGASYRERRLGCEALAHTFSLFASKTITTGEGGLITTNDDGLAQKARCLLNHGQTDRYWHEYTGFNYRMTEMQGALGTSQLRRIDTILDSRRECAEFYIRELSTCGGVHFPKVPEYVTTHAWGMFPILFETRSALLKVVRNLSENGIEYRRSFPPLDIQPAFKKDGSTSAPVRCPNARRTWFHKLDLPIWPSLRSDDIVLISGFIKACMEEGDKLK